MLVAVVLIPIHEGLHALAYPRSGRGEVIIGFWPKKFYFYAVYTGEMSRERLVAVFVAPFTVLSIAPLVYALSQDGESSALALASIINAGFSSADVYFTYLVISQIPRHSRVRNNGWKTYWH